MWYNSINDNTVKSCEIAIFIGSIGKIGRYWQFYVKLILIIITYAIFTKTLCYHQELLMLEMIKAIFRKVQLLKVTELLNIKLVFFFFES